MIFLFLFLVNFSMGDLTCVCVCVCVCGICRIIINYSNTKHNNCGCIAVKLFMYVCMHAYTSFLPADDIMNPKELRRVLGVAKGSLSSYTRASRIA